MKYVPGTGYITTVGVHLDKYGGKPLSDPITKSMRSNGKNYLHANIISRDLYCGHDERFPCASYKIEYWLETKPDISFTGYDIFGGCGYPG